MKYFSDLTQELEWCGCWSHGPAWDILIWVTEECVSHQLLKRNIFPILWHELSYWIGKFDITWIISTQPCFHPPLGNYLTAEKYFTCIHEGTWHCDTADRWCVAPGPGGRDGNYSPSAKLFSSVKNISKVFHFVPGNQRLTIRAIRRVDTCVPSSWTNSTSSRRDWNNNIKS